MQSARNTGTNNENTQQNTEASFVVVKADSDNQPLSSSGLPIILDTTDSNGGNSSDSPPIPAKRTSAPSAQKREGNNSASPNASRSNSTSSSNENSSFEEVNSNGSNGQRSNSTTPPAYDDLGDDTSSNDLNKSDTNDSTRQLIGSDEKTNRFWQKVKYLMTKKKIIMPFTALITMLSVASMTKPLIELVNMHNGINAFNILGGVVLASLALFGCWALIQSFRTKEHKITERDHSKVLAEVLEKLPNDKLIKYIMIDRSNGTRSYFQLQTLESETDKSFSISGGKIVKGHFMSDWLCAVSNRRMAVPVLFTALVFGNITLLLTHAMSSELSYSQIFSPALYINLHTAMVPTLLALGLMMICIISNIRNTECKTFLHVHNEKNCDPVEAKTEVIQHIANQITKEDKSRTIPSSKIIQAVAEFQDSAEQIFCIN
ncbi:MAG TPA: hypothetical protein DEQ74_02015 [Wolbachia sp.]|jgi:ribosomal protein S8|uniref:hypothetical protein n=1 Tax=Wolbachia endosymbiont of Pentalonia nigronervosa TaxID=1301914 RepID=UPI000ED54492|nr:hypothetical protein [Wolbachia endosymbiont of Pentalonia nigronervosa]MBD0390974.1 hypothetical protein [Wolbachia endosymbiont of Pentalonia nigronervosa]HCE59586.1 hypothetical protein [Wolbachia sp.]